MAHGVIGAKAVKKAKRCSAVPRCHRGPPSTNLPNSRTVPTIGLLKTRHFPVSRYQASRITFTRATGCYVQGSHVIMTSRFGC